MRKLLFLMLLLIADKAFSYDSTKLHIRLKIMDPTMLPVSPNAVTTYNSSFNTWMAQHHVTDLVKVFSDEYDNVGELKYRYKMFHDTDAYVLQAALDSMEGIKEVFIYDFVPYGYDIPACTSSFTPNDDLVDAANFFGPKDFKTRTDKPFENTVDFDWHLDKIQAECAWDITKGDTNVLIGILDSYMDTSHFDMRGKFKIWKHWNFGANDTLNLPEFNVVRDIEKWPYNWYTKGNNNTFYHGMKCAGAAASSFNNGTGISGIGGNCKLAGYSFLGFGKTNPDTSIIGWTDMDEAAMMAIEDGVKVINCSWGPAVGPVSANARAGFLMNELILYGISQGVVFTLVGGNPLTVKRNNKPELDLIYPLPESQFPIAEGAIIVTSSQPNDKLGFSYNHDTYIDVCAPFNIITTKIQYNPNFPGLASAPPKGGGTSLDRRQEETLTGFGGTSSSSALVAGIVGLMFSANPYLSPAAVECLLKAGCDTMNYRAMYNQSVTDTNISITIPSNHLGAGRVNAYNAVYLAKGESGSKYGSHTWNELRHIASDITLESGCVLTINHKTLISPNRKIIVKPGARLVVNGAVLTNLCGDGPWGGIVVLGNANAVQTPTNQGVVELKNGAVIENALIGVRAIGWFDGTTTPKPSTARGIIQATNTTFNNNQTDVVMLGQTFTSLMIPKANVSYFRKCTFITTNGSKIQNLENHFSITDCNGINITGCKFEDQRTGITAKAHGRTGIYAVDASFNVTDYNNGVTTTSTKFLKLKQAVKSISVPASGRTSISNVLVICYKGFYFNNNTFTRVINDSFVIKDDLFKYNSTTYPYGLYMDATSAFDVEHNTYLGTKTGIQITGGHGGLIIRDAGPNTTQFYRSIFTNITLASEALNENKDATDELRGLTFRCNDYTSSQRDLNIISEHDVDLTGSAGMADFQGSSTQPADNLFGNSSPKLYRNIDNQANGITYFHQDENVGTVNTRTKPFKKLNVLLTNTSSIIPQCPDNLVKSGTGWPGAKRADLSLDKATMTTANTAWKAAIDHGNSPTNVVNDIETATTGNATFVYNLLISYSPWLSMKALAALAAEEGVFTDLQIRNVLIANPQAGRSGWIQSILLNRSSAFSPFYINAIKANADSTTNRDTLAMEVAEANQKYDLLLNDLVGWYIDDTIDHLATFDTLLTHPYNPMYRYQLAGMYFERNMYTEYQTVLDSIASQIDLTDKEADYLQTYNDLYDQIKLWKQDSVPLPILDSSQLVWLNTFYDEHPIMPGIGHALLAINDTAYRTTDPVYITDTTAYLEPEPFIANINDKKRTEITKLVKVYPNPTDKNITLEWLTIEKPKSRVIINDQLGKKIVEKEWKRHQKTIEINLSDFPSGIYYCNIVSDGKIVEVHKVYLNK
jgi:hypothetical protein